MLKILHLGKYYPPDRGGIESVTSSLARGAQRAGHDVTVLCFREIAIESNVDSGVNVIRTPGIKLASQPIGILYLIKGYYLARRADIVHAHLPNMLAALQIALLRKGPKVILHWHSDVIGKGILSSITKPLEKGMLSRADQIICTSEAYADASQCLKAYKHKIKVIPIGIADTSKIIHHREKTQLPNYLLDFIGNRPLILAIGRLVPYKGYDVLVNAAQYLASDAAIIIVGGGPLKSRIAQMISEKRVSDQVYLAGQVSDSVLHQLLKTAQIYCMPSIERSEAFGVSIVEAMSAGLPIVATEIPGSGVPWVNKSGISGLNTPPNDPYRLACALNQLIASPELRKEFSKGSRQRFVNLFTEDKFISEVLNVYHNVKNSQH